MENTMKGLWENPMEFKAENIPENNIKKRIEQKKKDKIKDKIDKPGENSSSINYRIIGANESALKFYNYLDRPAWFMEKFIPTFEYHRKTYDGKLIIYSEDNSVRGCLYYVEKPPVFYNSKKVPIFGWVQSESSDILQGLVSKAKFIAKKAGYSMIRGPINLPKMFGGWGYIDDGFRERLFINSAWNSERTANYISSISSDKSVETTTYYHYKMRNFNFGCENDLPDVEIYSPPLFDLLHDFPLQKRIGKFISENFSVNLPDTSSVELQFRKVISIISQVENPRDYYQIGIDSTTGEIAALSVHIPNIFDLWKDKGGFIESANHDTFIMGKDYRRSDFSRYFWHQSQVKLIDAGIKEIINSYLWEHNVFVIKKAAHVSDLRNTLRVHSYLL